VPDPYRILLVDDDETMAQTLKCMMDIAPYSNQVTIAKDGKEALELLRNNKPDAMILDLMLPEISGQEVLKTIENDSAFKGFPVIVNSTAGDLKWNKQEILACQNVRVEILPRPCDHQQLIALMQKLLGIS
jgi:CheY-like chemotaxis protein